MPEGSIARVLIVHLFGLLIPKTDAMSILVQYLRACDSKEQL